jgi:hypothetical protein
LLGKHRNAEHEVLYTNKLTLKTPKVFKYIVVVKRIETKSTSSSVP